jgi:hypothetical protein
MPSPPRSSSEETPRAPSDSILPRPSGKRGDGGERARETVARVRRSLTRSVREWTASAVSAGRG